MPRRSLLAIVIRVLNQLDVPFQQEGDSWLHFGWTHEGDETPTPVSLVVVAERLIACYAVVTGVDIGDERWDAANEWVARANQQVIVGNFELGDDGVLLYKNALDAHALDTRTVERVAPELWALAVRMAAEHREEIARMLDAADQVAETLDDAARDLLTGVLDVVEARYGNDVSEGVAGALEQVVETYLQHVVELRFASRGDDDDDGDDEGDDEADAALSAGGAPDFGGGYPGDDEDDDRPAWEREAELELPAVQYELEGDEAKATLVLRAPDVAPMRYHFRPADILARMRSDEVGIELYYHTDPEAADRVVAEGFLNERHSVVLNDVTVDGIPQTDPERVVTRRVLLTTQPRPRDDRAVADATVLLRWTGDARALASYEWARTAFAEREEGGWEALPVENPVRRFLVPAAVLNQAERDGLTRLERVGS